MDSELINFNHVKVKKLNIEDDDGVTREYHMLVLDTDANKFYWEEYTKLHAALTKLDPDLIDHWEISTEYLNKAITEMIEQLPDYGITLFGLPIRLVSEGAYCRVILKDGTYAEV